MIKTGSLLRLTVILGMALGAGACSTLADLDPTGLLGGDSKSGNQFPDAAPQASDASVGTTPDLASLPDRPTNTTAAQQQQTAQSLAADGAQVQYSADALRGGTEAAAPVPGAAGPVIAAAAPPPDDVRAPAADDAPPSAQPAPAAPVSNDAPPSAAAPIAEAPSAQAPIAPPPNAAPSNALAAVPGGNPASAAVPPSAGPAPNPGPSAGPSGGEPAVPANTPVRTAALAGPGLTDSALGFQPSAAPPLNPSINQWVAAPIVAHYRQTASNAGISSPTALAAVPARGTPDMDGTVVANVGADGPASLAAMNGGVAPTAVVYFPADGIALSAAARAQIRSAVQAFKAGGGAGTVRVIGHASSRTANMSVEKHMETIFDKSQKRANAVAQELIHDGIPAARVLVEAVGDSQPIYYESMPKGEDGNRRAEIFVQS